MRSLRNEWEFSSSVLTFSIHCVREVFVSDNEWNFFSSGTTLNSVVIKTTSEGTEQGLCDFEVSHGDDLYNDQICEVLLEPYNALRLYAWQFAGSDFNKLAAWIFGVPVYDRLRIRYIFSIKNSYRVKLMVNGKNILEVKT